MQLATHPSKKLCALTTLLILAAFGTILAGQAGAGGNPPIPNAGGDRGVNEDEATWYYGDASDDEGDSLAFSWEFPGAEILDGQDVEYTFSEPGEYSVSLWVDDGTSNVSDTVAVTVLDVTAPDTEITDGVDRVVNEDTLQAFDASSSTDNVAIESYRWTFEDAGFAGSSTAVSPTYTWYAPGSYRVTLEATDAAGNTGAASLWMTILDITPPTASFTLATPAEATATQTLDGSLSFDNAAIDSWTWTVADDGFSSTLYGQTATYRWDTPGTYDVTLTVEDGADLSDSLTVSVTVLASEAPTASIALASSVPEDAAQLLDGSGSTDNVRIEAWTWSVGDDGFTAALSGETASYTWASVGTYSVTLTVTDTAGNTDASTVSVTVTDATAPVAVFSLPSAFDEDTEQTLDGTASSDNVGITSWTWYVEDWGGTFEISGDTALYTWYQPRAYQVTLSLSDAAGNVGWLTQVVTVLDITPPYAAFSLAASFNEDTVQALDGRASDDNVAVVSWEWLIEDAGGTVSGSGDSVTYTWAEPGTYQVMLTVADAAGNTGNSTRAVTVLDVTPPTAVISVAARFRVGQAQTLGSSLSSDNVGLVDWAWVIEDGGSTVDLPGATQTYTWTTPGSYAVALTVTDGAGLWALAVASVEVLEATPPLAVFSLASPFDEDTLQTLDGSLSTDNVGVVSWEWTLEDAGFTATRSGAVSTYSWTTPGTYRVTLTVADAALNSASKEVTVEVLDVTPPVAAFALPSSTGNAAVSLDGTESFDNVGVVSWTWTLEEVSGPVTLTGSTASHAWRTPGTYTVKLAVSDAAGNAAEKVISLVVHDSTAPAASAGPDQTVSEDTVVGFDGIGTGDNDPAFPTGGSFTWSFNDGGARVLTGSLAYYTFWTPGTYDVTLTVVDAAGNTGTDSLRVNVLDTTPPVAFFALPGSVAEDMELALSGARSTDNVGIVNWTWTIQDHASTSTHYGSTASYLWSTPGTYDLTLTVRDAAGNSAAYTASVLVADLTPPVARAGPDLVVDEDTLTTFDASASTDNGPGFPGDGIFVWLFNDGALSPELRGGTAEYTFATPGTYAVTLVVLDASGNMASDFLTVRVRDLTDPSVVVAGGLSQTFNEDTLVTLSATLSTDNDPAFAATGRFTWSFTDGSPVTLQGAVVQYRFSTPGLFEVTMTAMDAGGNAADSDLRLDILDVTAPTASFGGPLSLNEDTPLALDGTASSDNSEVARWTWTVEVLDGTESLDGALTSYTWATPGLFDVTLTVTDSAGFTASLTRSVKVIDTTAPAGSATVPATASESQDVTFSSEGVQDNDPTFASTRRDVWSFDNNGAWTQLSGTAPTFTFRAPGTYLVHLHVTDAAGNFLERTFELVVPDTTPPWIDVFVPTDGALVNTPRVQVVGVAEPGATVRLNGDPVPLSQGAFDFQLTLTDGTNTLAFVVRDAAGNEATQTLSVRFHAGPPTIQVTAPLNGSTTKADKVTVTGAVDEAFGPSMTLNGAPVTLAPNGAFSVEVPLTEGANVLRFEARDDAGNLKALVLTVVRDSKPVVLGVRTVGTFIEGSNIKTYQTSVPVAGTTEPGATVRLCVQAASGTLECNALTTAADGTFRYDAALRPGTTTTIRVEATDAAGNSAVEEFTVVQMAAPEGAVQGPDWGLLSVTGLLAGALVVALLLPMRRKK